MTDQDDEACYTLDVDNKNLDRPMRPDPAFERRVEQLNTAMQRIQRGELPGAAELEQSPRLDHWAVCIDGPFPVLVGVVSNHPLLDDGWITTSPLIFISDDKQLARTVSRFYRLAAPLIDSGAPGQAE